MQSIRKKYCYRQYGLLPVFHDYGLCQKGPLELLAQIALFVLVFARVV
jgi:hypothetical protein